MVWQTGMDPKKNRERVFAAFHNSTTGTSTVSIAAGTPVVLETTTASADGTFIAQAQTSTSVINNLYVGNAHTTIAADKIGLVQIYGVDDDVIVATAGASVGAMLIPNIATFVTAGTTAQGGITTANATVVLIAPTGAAQAATSVFVCAM